MLQQELQNPYWCLHDTVTTKSYQISTEMDIETTSHAMYFSGNAETVTKINDTPFQVFIDNGATPSILLVSTYNKHPVLQRYPKTKSTPPIHTGGVTI